MDLIDKLHSEWLGCKRCGLCVNGTKQVFSDGKHSARLMAVGESPGRTEWEVGKPFVGPAGQLVTNEFAKHDIHREDIYWTNVVRGYPHEGTKTRQPNNSELEVCKPLILSEINIIKPRFILIMGTIAARSLLNHKGSLSALTGKWVTLAGIPALVTWHPAAILWASSKNQDKYEQYKSEFERDIAEISARLTSEVTAIIPEKTIIPQQEEIF